MSLKTDRLLVPSNRNISDNLYKQLYLPHTKAGFGRNVPLNNEAVKVLAYKQEQRNGSPWVFPDKDLSKPISTPRKASTTAVQGFLKEAA